MFLKSIVAALTFALVATSAVAAPHGHGKHGKHGKSPKVKATKVPYKNIMPIRPPGQQHINGSSLSCESTPSAGAISNAGGQIISGNVNIYYIFYGTWSQAQKDILINFGQNVGGSPYYNIEKSYGASGQVTYVNSTDDNYSLGKSLSDADLPKIVQTAITNGLPTDPNAVYFINTAADVTETGGFCSQYCGFHTNAQINGKNLFYAFIGNPASCLAGCAPCNANVSPNGDLGVDAMVSILAHELVEAVSDPNGDAWRDASGYENADKCAYTYGQTQKDTNGAIFNMKLGGRNYLVQQNWDATSQSCKLSA